MCVKTNDSRAFVTVCLNQVLKCFLHFEHMKLLPQTVDKIKIRFAEDIGTSITSNKTNILNEALLAKYE